MSSGFFPLDDGFDHHHHHPDFDDMINLDDLPFLFSPSSDVSLDSIFQDIPEQPNPINPEEPNLIIPDPNLISQDPVPNPDPASNFIPIEQTTETLIPADTFSLEQITQTPTSPSSHFPDPRNSSNFSNGFVAGDGFGAGNELPPCFAGGQNVADVQGGYNCGPQFNGMPWRPYFQPSYPTFGGPPAFLGSGNNFTFDQFGRPYCTGGMQRGSFYRPTFVDDETPRTRRYNPEERKKKIEKYREKRSQRNFSKTIKWLRAYQEFEGNLHASRRAKVRLGRLLLQTGVGMEKMLKYALDYLS